MPKVRPWFERLTDEDNHWLQAGVAESEGDNTLAETLYLLDASHCETKMQLARAALSRASAAKTCDEPLRRIELFAHAGETFEAAATLVLRDNPWLAYQLLGSAHECYTRAAARDALVQVEKRQRSLRDSIDPA